MASTAIRTVVLVSVALRTSEVRKIFFPVLFLCCDAIFAQQIEVKIKNLIETRCILFSLEGEETTAVDTFNAVAKDSFKFNMGNAYHHTGFYRLSFNSHTWVAFIYHGGDVILVGLEARHII